MPRTRAWTSVLGSLCLIALLAPSRPAASQANPVLLLTDGGDDDPAWLSAWTKAMEDEGYPVICAGNQPWPGEPSPAELQAAQKAYDEGLNLFLELDLKGAADRFQDAYARFERLLSAHPFHRESSQGSLLAGFYWARALVESSDRRGASRILTDFIEEHPTADPDPSIFPPAFRQLVDGLKRGRSRRGSGDLTLELTPTSAAVTLGNVVLEPSPDGTITLPDMSHGSYRLAVGMPGLGMREQTIRMGIGAPPVRVNLLTTPQGLPLPKSGQPWPASDLSAMVRLLGSGDILIWLSDASSIGLPSDRVAYIQEINTGQVTAAIVIAKQLSPQAASAALARATIASSKTADVEVFRATSRGVTDDDATRQTVLHALGIQQTPKPDLEEITEDDARIMSLGIHAGTGFGLAVHVSQPGFAPTPLLVRPDIAFALSENLDIGAGARVQISKVALLGEPYLQWRTGIVRLRGGLAIGQISQTITDTENRDRSTQRWVGPSAGLGVNLGPLQLGASAITTLVPDQSVQLDVLLGLVFDL